MIKIEKGIVEIHGLGIFVEAEFCSLIHVMKKQYGEEKTRELFELTMMPIEELKKKAEEKEKTLVGIMGEDFAKKNDEVFDSLFREHLERTNE